MEAAQSENQIAQDVLSKWQMAIHDNAYSHDKDFIHTIEYYFPNDFSTIHSTLEKFGAIVANELEIAVKENHANLPRLETYNGIGERVDKIIHHPTYAEAGNLIYSTNLLAKMSEPRNLLEGLSLFFLSSQAGEAGHNCPIACSLGIIRVLQKTADFPDKLLYLKKLVEPSYQTNFTGAQFLTEIQGGSDVGKNATLAIQNDTAQWRIYGEKWFCSNADADLIFVTARFNEKVPGTKGLGLFLIPAIWQGKKNFYFLRRLKDKLGTRTMATGEIDFNGAYAISIGDLQNGFLLAMENVLHVSRLLNSFTVVAMARKSYGIAYAYANHRIAFGNKIIHYPLVKENLARIKSENTALLASIFAMAKLQEQFDLHSQPELSQKLILRLLINIQKYLTAKWSVEHVHHSLDVLAGNGTIETFSSIPRLLRDCIVCENWEGTHNVLMMQVLKDMHKYKIDKVYFSYMYGELAKLTCNENKDFLNRNLQKLEQEIALFYKSDETVQALQIRIIVDRMAILFSALHLLFEALDQKNKMYSSSKINCFYYFSRLHIDEEKKSYDKEYLALIDKVLEL